jgi:hypothetical protein
VAVDLRATAFNIACTKTAARRSAATFAHLAAFFAVAIFLLLPALSSAALAPANPGAKPAFIERIPPSEFLAVEELSLHRFTANNEVVILKTEYGKVTYALALRTDPKAGFIWDAYFVTPGTEPKEPTVSIEFDAKVASQYVSALNYRMSRWVTVVEKSHKPASYDGAWWIYYKVENGAVAGLIDTADLVSIPEAQHFVDLFIEAPKRLLVADTPQQPAILELIETQCRDLIRAELRK